MHVWLRVLSDIWCRHIHIRTCMCPCIRNTDVDKLTHLQTNQKKMFNQLTPRVYNLLICCLFQHFFHLHSRNPPSRVSRSSTTGFSTSDVTFRRDAAFGGFLSAKIRHGNIAMGNSTRNGHLRDFPFWAASLASFWACTFAKKKWLARCFKWPWNLYKGRVTWNLNPLAPIVLSPAQPEDHHHWTSRHEVNIVAASMTSKRNKRQTSQVISSHPWRETFDAAT